MPADRVLAAFFGGADAGDRLVIWQIRLPRALAAYLTGAALGILWAMETALVSSGIITAAFQQSLRLVVDSEVSGPT